MVPRAVALFTRKITTVTLSGMRSALTVYADRDVAVRLINATTTESTWRSDLAQPPTSATRVNIPRVTTPQPANERLKEVETKPSNKVPIPGTRCLRYSDITSSTMMSAPWLSIEQLTHSSSTKGHMAEQRSSLKNILAQLAYSQGYNGTLK